MTVGRMDGGDCNIPIVFLKKRGDKYYITFDTFKALESMYLYIMMSITTLHIK